MGIYDRQYYSEEHEPRGFQLGGSGGQRMLVTKLVIINVVVYLIDYLTAQHITAPNGQSVVIGTISKHLTLQGDFFAAPWSVWQFLTYGFLHDLNSVTHILFNMVGLWMLGREVELKYGQKIFLQFYLSTIVLSGVGWLASQIAMTGSLTPQVITPHGLATPHLLGASGGVLGVITLFIFNFPKRTLYLWGIVPAPAWVLGVMIGLGTIFTGNDPENPVAHSAHAAGIACGVLFFYTKWQLGVLIPQRLSLSALRAKPKIRIHDPDAKARRSEEKMSSDVDRILEKISREGEASLTSRERMKLEEASRRYQDRNS